MSNSKKDINMNKKIINFLKHIKKNWIFYLIILVLFIILFIIFGFWNPFGFLKRPARIQNTTINIEEIKQIGEFVTAKYYGEVLGSLGEKQLEITDNKIRKTFNQVKYIFEYLVNVYLKDEKVENINKETFAYRRLKNRVKRNNRFKIMIKSDRYKILKVIGDKEDKKDDFDYIFDQVLNKEFEQFVDENKSNYNVELNEYNKDILENSEISYIGRGWVKAGFNLEELDIDKMEVKDKTLIIKEFPPIILDVDINPWFIYDKNLKIKGFEIISISHPRQISFEQIKQVKNLCREKLKADALEYGIKEKAKENAEQTFSEFIKILDTSGNIENVYIQFDSNESDTVTETGLTDDSTDDQN